MRLEEYKDKILKEDDGEKRQQILLDAVSDEELEDEEFSDLMSFALIKVNEEK